MKVLLLYYTKTGHTLEAANATAEGIRAAGSEVDLVPVEAFDADQLANYDALIVGSPCWAGSLTSLGVADPVVEAVGTLAQEDLAGKKVGGISVHSATGGATTVNTLGKMLAEKGCTDYTPGPVARAGVPFSLWKGSSVRPEDLEQFRAFGRAFVT